MKVLICSDSHTRLDYFQKVMNLEEPEMVIFAGDHSTDAMDMALIYSEIPFKIVKGNTDYYDYDTKDTEIFELNGKKYFLHMGHLYGDKEYYEGNRGKSWRSGSWYMHFLATLTGNIWMKKKQYHIFKSGSIAG